MAADEQLSTIAEVSTVWSGFAALPAPEQQSLIDVASQKILNFCRRGFVQSNENEFHDGKNQPSLWLNKRPVITVAAVTVNDIALDNSDGTEWLINSKTGELVRGRYLGNMPGSGDRRFRRMWPAGIQNIEIQYWAGYASVPDPIKRGVAFYCQYLRAQLAATGVFSSESIGDYSYTLNTMATKWGVPSTVLDLILDYVQDDGPL